MSSLQVGALSHIGLVRRENQDRMSRFACPFGEVFIVADGMGGHKGGSQAASMVVDGFERWLRQPPPQHSLRAAMKAASVDVNAGVCAAATSGDPLTDHMGSTAVILVVSGREVLIGHLGDSRAYLWRAGRLVRLTRDHTWVQQLVDQHLLSEEEARNHPEASVLAHAFGRESELSLELSPSLAIRPGDAILLCSDGLSGDLTDDVIAGILAGGDEPQQAVGRLVEAALATGGHDNITAQLVVFAERPRRHLLRLLSRGGRVRHAPGREPEVRPAAEPGSGPPHEAGSPPASPVVPGPAETPLHPLPPELIPTEPALPLAPLQAAPPTPLPRRRHRVAGPLVVVATLAGAVMLVLGLWRTLRPPSPPVAAAPAVAPTPSPTPALEPTPGPAPGEPTPVPSPITTPTRALTPGQTEPGGTPTGDTP
ncbi:MAG: protein phosphatase 2C domain-containing protein [Thermoanaerobaculaceae bacterium]|nr:protein phosphatase 2C domain-containing protein [Thermoanaerobaculaceae bacterium]